MRVRTRAQMVIAPARLTFEIALATADLAITPNTVLDSFDTARKH